MHRLPVTVVILTFNEEHNLPGALESVKDWAEDVFVVDSCSADRTVDVALEYGIPIVQRPFTNYGDQWRWALDRLPIKSAWVMKLDADERVSASLREEMRTRIEGNPPEAGFIVRIRLWFLGRPLHAMVKTCRLWRRDKGAFSEVIVNEHLSVDGPVGRLSGFIEHMDSPNLHRWYEKQNRYTTMEAIMRVRGDKLAAQPRLFGNALQRRMFLKKKFVHVPFRFPLFWLYQMIGQGVWRDGAEGRQWARLRVEVMRMIELKAQEMLRTGQIPRLEKTSNGDFDPRVVDSRLQKAVLRCVESPVS